MVTSFFNFDSSSNSDSGSNGLEEEWQKSKQAFLSVLYLFRVVRQRIRVASNAHSGCFGVISLEKERLLADFDNEFNQPVLQSLNSLIQFLLRLIALNVGNPHQLFRTILNDHLSISLMR